MAERRPASLTLRLAASYALVALVLMGGSSVLLYRALAQAGWRDDAEDVRHAARMVARRMAESGRVEPRDLEGDAGVRVRVLDSRGRLLLEGPGMARMAPESLLPGAASGLQRLEGPGDTDLLVEVLPCPGGLVQAAKDLHHRERLLGRYREFLALNAALVAVLSALAGWLIARRGLAPLERLSRAVSGIRPETLTARLSAAEAPLELQDLTASLNGVLERLEAAFTRLGTLNADMAHELRTPIHALRLEVEGLLARPQAAAEERLASMMETLVHLGDMIEQMLFLARTEDPATHLKLERLEAAHLLEKARGPFGPLAEERDVTLAVAAPPDLAVTGDPTLLRRALHNLLANALRHAPAGSAVGLAAREVADGVALEVSDQGEGIPPEALARLGQRFLRPDPSRSRGSGGAGLGLAIVQGIARMHGGRLEVVRLEPAGTLARLVVPRA